VFVLFLSEVTSSSIKSFFMLSLLINFCVVPVLFGFNMLAFQLPDFCVVAILGLSVITVKPITVIGMFNLLLTGISTLLLNVSLKSVNVFQAVIVVATSSFQLLGIASHHLSLLDPLFV
jgi:hypothetical protein